MITLDIDIMQPKKQAAYFIAFPCDNSRRFLSLNNISKF